VTNCWSFSFNGSNSRMCQITAVSVISQAPNSVV